MPDQNELLFKLQLKFKSEDDWAACVEFYPKARLILVCSRLGENIAITRNLN